MGERTAVIIKYTPEQQDASETPVDSCASKVCKLNELYIQQRLSQHESEVRASLFMLFGYLQV